MSPQPMPVILKVTIGLLALSIALAALSEAWVSALVSAALLAGVVRGSEGARMIMMGLGALGVLSGLPTLVGAVLGAGLTSGAGPDFSGAFLVLFLSGAIQVGASGLVVWCFNRIDVQSWMFARSVPMPVD